jgi:hypothetical protein
MEATMFRKIYLALLAMALLPVGGCGGGSSSQSSGNGITVSPTGTAAGSPDLVLTIGGANFTGKTHNRSLAFWSVNSVETALGTTFVAATTLKAMVPSALLAEPVTANVFVRTGDPMGDVPLHQSDPATFTVFALPAGSTVITSVSPSSAVAGSTDVLLSITGDGFEGRTHFRSYVVWTANTHDTFLATTFVSSNQLTALLPAALITSPLTAQIAVQTGDVMGDVALAKSNIVNFNVTAAVGP